MNTHREAPRIENGVCVDCKKFYECSIRETAEWERDSHVVECSGLEEDS